MPLKQPQKEDYDFQIGFFESIYKRDNKEVRIIEILGHLYTVTKQYKLGLKMDRLLVHHKPEDSISHYNLACSYSLVEDTSNTIKYLTLAVELGYDDFEWMNKDPDLDFIREDPEFLQILISIKKPEDPFI
jgi:hypothetical protein|tara:strand:- start:364 stop:756 length:393 start_codon:yes stop_codon:yes gene_type:complete